MNREDHLFPELLDPARLAGPVLVLMPHPDDEVIGCGGMMALHRQAGQEVTVVHASAGEGGDPEGRFPDLAQRRAREVERALARLGVGPPRCLGCRDGELHQVPDLTERLLPVLGRRGVATLYLPSPLDCHSDHRVLARAAAAAAGRTCPPEAVCMVTGINNMGLPNTLVDITSVLEAKEEALRCFASQLSYIDFASKVMWRDRAATVNIEDRGVLACEAFMRLPAGRLASFARAAGDLEDILYGG